jgi:hypothetical protein
MAQYPYYTEPTHAQGAITNASGNAARDTADSSTEGRLIVDAVDKIFLLEPNKHPLVSLLTNAGKVWDGKSWVGAGMLKAEAGNPEFKWFEDVYGGRYARVSGTYSASGAVTVTVSGAGSSSAYIFTVGDVMMNARTGERLLVATIASATTITVASAGRAFGTTAAAAGADGDSLFIIGNVNEENGIARNVNSTLATSQTNYTQIFKTTIALSNTQKASNLYGGGDLPYQRAKKGTEHALDIERAFWFGEKKLDQGGTQGHERRATGGVHEFINSGGSYVQNQGGAITAPDFNTFLREGFTYGGTTKMLFAGGIVLQALNEIARGQIQMAPMATSYGMKISAWTTPFGVVNIVHNPMFVEDFAGSAYLLDMECFRARHMKGRDTQLQTNIQAPDVDGVVDQYLTETGLERKQAPRHAMLKGVTS